MEEAVEDAEPHVEGGDGELEDALDGVHEVALHRMVRVLDGGVDVLRFDITTKSCCLIRDTAFWGGWMQKSTFDV